MAWKKNIYQTKIRQLYFFMEFRVFFLPLGAAVVADKKNVEHSRNGNVIASFGRLR